MQNWSDECHCTMALLERQWLVEKTMAMLTAELRIVSSSSIYSSLVNGCLQNNAACNPTLLKRRH